MYGQHRETSVTCPVFRCCKKKERQNRGQAAGRDVFLTTSRKLKGQVFKNEGNVKIEASVVIF